MVMIQMICLLAREDSDSDSDFDENNRNSSQSQSRDLDASTHSQNVPRQSLIKGAIEVSFTSDLMENMILATQLLRVGKLWLVVVLNLLLMLRQQ
jgi:hypothetical protein